MTTRRTMIKFFSAAALVPALPLGLRPVALAAENTGTDVIENDQADREISAQKWTVFAFGYPGATAAEFSVVRGVDGSARLRSSRDVPDVVIPAEVFAALDHAVWAFADRPRESA
jgi:hypothetical protein